MMHLAEILQEGKEAVRRNDELLRHSPDNVVSLEDYRQIRMQNGIFREAMKGQAGLNEQVEVENAVHRFAKQDSGKESILVKLNQEFFRDAKEIWKNVKEAVTRVFAATGNDAKNFEVDSLPDNVAGTFRLSDKQRTVDRKFLSSEKLFHILLHETWHLLNKILGDGEIIKDIDFEEALTESATAQTTGKVLAYEQHMHLIDEVARANDIEKSELIWLFKSGQNGKLNVLYDEAFDSENEKMAA